jgi:hypothetical protein
MIARIAKIEFYKIKKITAETADVRRENAEIALALTNQFPSPCVSAFSALPMAGIVFLSQIFNRPGPTQILLCAPLRFAAASAVKGFGCGS